MKKIFSIAFFFFSLLTFTNRINAQTCCVQISVGSYLHTESSNSYYYGVWATLNQTYDQDVTVNGQIFRADKQYINNFSVTVPAGETSIESSQWVLEVPTGTSVLTTITSVTPSTITKDGVSYNTEITATYAGVTITYEAYSHLLRFNSVDDVNAVLDQLDADYDSYNDNYDATLDPNLTPDQQDDADSINGFDEFRKLRDFEELFPGFNSKRKEIENLEAAWLDNNFAGTDPDDVDLTFDDAANAIFNSDYSFKVGSDLYQLTADDMYINGGLTFRLGGFKEQANYTFTRIFGNSGNIMNEILSNNVRHFGGPMMVPEDGSLVEEYNSDAISDWSPLTICKSNKKKKQGQTFGSDRYELKVAIHSWIIRSGVKGKVVHFKSKHGKWKRRRAKMAVLNGGYVYGNLCNSLFSFTDRKPSSSFKSRRQLKVARHIGGIIWKTNSGELTAGFDTPSGTPSGSLQLNF